MVASAATADGQARAAVLHVVLDTTPPSLASAAVTPDPFSPNGDGAADTATLRYTPGESCSARVQVLDAGGAVVRKLTGWRAVSAAGHAVTWDGRVGLAARSRPPPKAATACSSACATRPAMRPPRVSPSPWTAPWAS